jgi:putative endonuclease
VKKYFVYILASGRNGTLYTGMTSNLLERVNQHKQKQVKGFTKKYNVDRLVYYESTEDVRAALKREKQLKTWKRKWKLDLIEKHNPDWKDLSGY